MRDALPVVLVTAVGAPPGLNALRALYETGRFTLLAVDSDYRSTGLYQYAVQREIVPMACEEERYVEKLIEIALKYKVSVILPCIDAEIAILSKWRKEVEKCSDAVLLLPDDHVVTAIVNKDAATSRAKMLGFDVPLSIRIPIRDNESFRRKLVEDFALECPLPWIIKPVVGHGMRQVVELHSHEEALSHVAAADVDLLLQEYIPGGVGSMHMVGLIYDAKSNVRRSFLSRSIRTLYPNGGPATGGVSVKNDDLIEKTKVLIDSHGPWKGPVCAEWMFDPRDSTFKFIEINPRLWGYGYLAVGSGSNFPAAVADLALRREIGPDPGYKTGVCMLRASVDLIFDRCPPEFL